MKKPQLLLLDPSAEDASGGAPARPGQVYEPPAEVVETLAAETPSVEAVDDSDNGASTVTMADFLKTMEKPAETPQKETEEVEEPPKAELKPTEQKPAVSKPVSPNARDYSDIPDEDKDLFKNMNNAAFAKLKPVYLEHKRQQAELAKYKEDLVKYQQDLETAKKGGLPDSYFEHPDGYQFDPEYKQAAQNSEYASAIVNHWAKQLENIEKGEDWQDLVFDAQGNAQLSAPQKSDAVARAAVMRVYQKAINAESTYRTRATDIKSSFANKSKEISNQIRQAEESWFPEFKDDKSELAIIAKDIKGKLPLPMQISPLSTVIARAITTVLQQKKQLESLNEQLKQAKVNPAAPQGKRTVQPTSKDMGASTITGTGKKEVTYADFQKVINGLD